jgi:hypothetical protein
MREAATADAFLASISGLTYFLYVSPKSTRVRVNQVAERFQRIYLTFQDGSYQCVRRTQTRVEAVGERVLKDQKRTDVFLTD